jgi:hypothetical protein
VHIDHDALKGPALEGLWVEYRGVNDINIDDITSSSITRDNHFEEANLHQQSSKEISWNGYVQIPSSEHKL